MGRDKPDKKNIQDVIKHFKAKNTTAQKTLDKFESLPIDSIKKDFKTINSHLEKEIKPGGESDWLKEAENIQKTLTDINLLIEEKQYQPVLMSDFDSDPAKGKFYLKPGENGSLLYRVRTPEGKVIESKIEDSELQEKLGNRYKRFSDALKRQKPLSLEFSKLFTHILPITSKRGHTNPQDWLTFLHDFDENKKSAGTIEAFIYEEKKTVSEKKEKTDIEKNRLQLKVKFDYLYKEEPKKTDLPEGYKKQEQLDLIREAIKLTNKFNVRKNEINAVIQKKSNLKELESKLPEIIKKCEDIYQFDPEKTKKNNKTDMKEIDSHILIYFETIPDLDETKKWILSSGIGMENPELTNKANMLFDSLPKKRETFIEKFKEHITTLIENEPDNDIKAQLKSRIEILDILPKLSEIQSKIRNIESITIKVKDIDALSQLKVEMLEMLTSMGIIKAAESHKSALDLDKIISDNTRLMGKIIVGLTENLKLLSDKTNMINKEMLNRARIQKSETRDDEFKRAVTDLINSFKEDLEKKEPINVEPKKQTAEIPQVVTEKESDQAISKKRAETEFVPLDTDAPLETLNKAADESEKIVQAEQIPNAEKIEEKLSKTEKNNLIEFLRKQKITGTSTESKLFDSLLKDFVSALNTLDETKEKDALVAFSFINKIFNKLNAYVARNTDKKRLDEIKKIGVALDEYYKKIPMTMPLEIKKEINENVNLFKISFKIPKDEPVILTELPLIKNLQERAKKFSENIKKLQKELSGGSTTISIDNDGKINPLGGSKIVKENFKHYDDELKTMEAEKIATQKNIGELKKSVSESTTLSKPEKETLDHEIITAEQYSNEIVQVAGRGAADIKASRPEFVLNGLRKLVEEAAADELGRRSRSNTTYSGVPGAATLPKNEKSDENPGITMNDINNIAEVKTFMKTTWQEADATEEVQEKIIKEAELKIENAEEEAKYTIQAAVRAREEAETSAKDQPDQENIVKAAKKQELELVDAAERKANEILHAEEKKREEAIANIRKAHQASTLTIQKALQQQQPRKKETLFENNVPPPASPKTEIINIVNELLSSLEKATVGLNQCIEAVGNLTNAINNMTENTPLYREKLSLFVELAKTQREATEKEVVRPPSPK